MGCVFGREASSGRVNEVKEETREGESRKSSKNLNVESGGTVRVGDTQGVDKDNGEEVSNGVTRKEEKVDVDRRSQVEKRRSRPNPRLSNPPKHKHGEQVAAGWPSWLSAHVGEAIDGWLPRRADTFEKIDKVGQLPLSFFLSFVFMKLVCGVFSP